MAINANNRLLYLGKFKKISMVFINKIHLVPQIPHNMLSYHHFLRTEMIILLLH